MKVKVNTLTFWDQPVCMGNELLPPACLVY